MKIQPKNIRKHQTGGQMTYSDEPVQEPIEQPTGEVTTEQSEDPMMMLTQMASQALQSQDCSIAMQACQVFLEIMQQVQGGIQEESQGEPVFARNGAKLKVIKRIKN